MAKLTKNELAKVQSMLNSFNQLKMQLGDAELQKQTIINQIDEVKEEYSKIEAELAEKYGANARINVQTGEVEEKEEEPDKQE